MKKLLVQRRSLITEYGRYHFVYELLKSNCDSDIEKERACYGIRILQFKEDGILFDRAEVMGITEDQQEAEGLFHRYVEESVMPVQLTELIDDWNCAFR